MTFLFVPAHEDRKVARALQAGSDAVVLDLEDSVPDDMKAAARAAIPGYVDALPAGPHPEVWVRVNAAGATFDQDVAAIEWPRLAGAVLPKAESPAKVAALDQAGAKRILLLVESAVGLGALRDLVAASHRVERCAIGTWDLSLDLGLLAIEDPDDAELMWQVRGNLVVQSRQLDLRPPIDGIYARLDDDEGLRAACIRALRLGYGGKLLVHPRQIPVAQSVFGPDHERIRLAREIVDAYEQGVREGRGAVQVRGRLVDRPMVDRARALVERWKEPLP